MGFYMGGRQPYGFELVPTVIHNIKTKKLQAITAEVEQIQYIFEVYAQESVSLRRLLDILQTNLDYLHYVYYVHIIVLHVSHQT